MIPLKLTLKNFMSYGEERTTLDFSGMHVACLSGDNGNGKSALLDAITYALWGETRVSGSQASGEDDLIRLGADEMEVTFEFLLNEERYRVIRKRNRRTRTGDWQAFAADPDGSWRSISGAGIRETRRSLVNLLHMEYETFLNSAYIQQGRADEFTRNKPDARKRILSDILGLSRYDRLEELAKERRNECDLQLRDLEGDIRTLESQLKEEPQNRQRLQERERALEALTKTIEEISSRRNSLQTRLLELEKRQTLLRECERQLQHKVHETEELTGQISQLKEEIERAATLLKEKPAITQDYETLCRDRERVKTLEPVMKSLQSMQEEAYRLEHEIRLSQQRTESELKHLTMLCGQAAERQKKIREIDHHLQEIAQRLTPCESLEGQRAQLQTEIDQRNQKVSEYKTVIKQMNAEIQELEEVIDLLRQPRSICPVCESDLSGNRQTRVLSHQEKKLSDLQTRRAAIKRQGASLRDSIPPLEAQLEQIVKQLQEMTGLQERERQYRRQREELNTQNRSWAQWREQTRALQEMLDRQEYGAEERARLRELNREREKLSAREAEYWEAMRSVAALTERQVERRHTQLEEAERSHAQRLQALSQQQARLKQRQEEIAEERKRLETLRQELIELPELQRMMQQVEEEFQKFAREKEQVHLEAGRLQKALEDCVKWRSQLDQKRSERERFARDKQAYADLSAAFGKKGIQAHIIENALPEIQDEANRLLARMTDNSMQVSLRTVRQGRSTGQQIETLDIVITDDAGERPYEMFSGGEAFRVNFALRIALSRLLTRRAGASLQTLILDEGFGTQDVKGRDRIVEAIQSVKDEFALILVISHIEALKDAFPTRIEVIKTPFGSQINYLE